MADQDTSIGAGRSAFARTQWSDILRAGAGSRELMESLAASYWRPVYKFIRVALRKRNEEAKDLAQDFFATVFQPEWMARADPARGSFRTFLLASLKNFVRDAEKHKGAQKRGGGARIVPIDAMDEDERPADASTPEQAFMRSWADALLAEALGELERALAGRGRDRVFQAFRAYCLESEPGRQISYETLAQEMGVSVVDVTNYLSEARRELRAVLVKKVGRYVASEREIDAELRELFGA